MGEISIIGLDLAKNVFQVHGVDASGAVVLRRQLRRAAVERFFANCHRAWWGWKLVAAPITGVG
jgi:transposase